MNNIDIALTFNDGYIKQATVVMYSVLKNSSREYKYHFWLVTYDLKSEREKEIRRALVEFEEMYSLDIVYID
ncbi:MAG: hypothetical protein LBK70_00535, partial [Clostridiales bacterium]|nr:hypothetical protein [Clostridiales bacterium]